MMKPGDSFLVRRLRPSELPAALRLCWETFLLYEAPDYGPEGVETFRRDMIESAAYRRGVESGEHRVWGAFDGETLCGVMGMRRESHICLVFTHKDYQRRGVATAIFQKLLADVRRENPNVAKITLNSSPYGLPFYHHIGFVDTAPQTEQNGIIYTPMEYRVDVY